MVLLLLKAAILRTYFYADRRLYLCSVVDYT